MNIDTSSNSVFAGSYASPNAFGTLPNFGFATTLRLTCLSVQAFGLLVQASSQTRVPLDDIAQGEGD